MIIPEHVGFNDVGQGLPPGCIKLELPPSRLKYPPAPKADTDIIAAAQAKFVKTKNRLLYERETEGARKRIAALAAAYEKIAQQDEADRQLTLKETIDVLVGKGWTVKEVMSSATGKGSFQEQKNERYICPPGP